MLKRKINKTAFDALSDEMKGYYKADGADFVLDADDADELRRGRDREKTGRTEAEQERDRLKARLTEIEDNEETKKLGDIKTLDASWKTKHKTDVDAEKANTDKFKTLAEKLALGAHATKIAAELFTVPDVMESRVADRLVADFDNLDANGLPTVKVLDKDRKVSALTFDDLKKEFREDPKLAKIVVASRSSGSATRTTLPKIPGSAADGGDKPADLSKVKPSDLVAVLDARKGETE